MRIVIGGSSGFLGGALVPRLRAAGHDVVRLVRRNPAGADEVRWSPGTGSLDPAVVDGADAVVNLAGVGVADRRWDDAYRALIRSSRVGSTATLAAAIAAAGRPPGVLLNSSAVGFYGDTGDTEVDETSPAGDGYFPQVCQAWEAATAPAGKAGTRVVLLRTGVVVGRGGGLLKPMLPLFRLGLGGQLGNGRQWLPWISLADWVAAVEFLLTAEVTGPVNLTGPAPVRNAEFTRTLGRVLHRPAVLPVPGFALRLVLGQFGGEALMSQRVLPAVLTAAGYRFTHPDLESALRWSVGR
ncbi:MAG: TIGR01777 family protein [Actinobacteria bacterium 13_1_20CM_3_71_11]|nr:MAG: TIGR01777 family protein [Actinobacteria bacterium 13_1_20CM_3_71_11]